MSEKEVAVSIFKAQVILVLLFGINTNKSNSKYYEERTTPSMVYFFKENEYCVDLVPKTFLNQFPKNTVYSIKGIIVLNFDSKKFQKL